MVTVAIGPVESTFGDDDDEQRKRQFLAGFIDEFAGGNHLPELQTCGSDAAEEVQMLMLGIFRNIHIKDYFHATMAVLAFVSDFPHMLDDCENMDDDVKAIKEWADRIDSIPKIVEVVTKQFKENKEQIEEKIGNEKSDWAAGNY